jgi:hypothetical protein
MSSRKISNWALLFSGLLLTFAPLLRAEAQETTSREVPFYLLTSLPPRTTQEVVVELWDRPIGGVLIFDEPYAGPNALPVDGNGGISFWFGSLHQPVGLNPEDFPSGSSRYIDVTQAGGSVLSARQPLTAVAFALSPGLPGPQGPIGPTGPQGPPGLPDVQGNLTMVDSTATAGNTLKGGVPFVHNFGTDNTFIGKYAGNLTMSGNGENTASGLSALRNNTTGSENTATGATALQNNTIGFWNTATGYGALRNNETGMYNTASGASTLLINTTGQKNTASGVDALSYNEGDDNTAIGFGALFNNTTGSNNTGIGYNADVATGVLSNATAIGFGAVVNASNKIRFGNTAVTVIEGQVPYTYTSDRNEKENFRPTDANAVLTKLRGLSVTSWNYKGQDVKQFRHYGPVAQDFFAAFGHDAVGTIGTPTTITSGDLDGILMIATQALEKRTVDQEKEIAQLKARLEALERRLGTDSRAGL